jgi:hypothetical protein
VASDDVFEKVVDFFFGRKPIRSISLALSNAGIEGLRNNPFTEARGFSGREESVLLPCLMPGILAVDLIGLGERCVDAPNLGDGRSEAEVSGVGGILPRTLDGVLSDFPVLGRFTGVWDGKMD